MLQIDFSGKKFLVTGGAGTGVGAGICEAISACSGQLLVNDIDPEKAKTVADSYPNAFAVPGDVGDAKEVKRIFREIGEEHGTVHGLVNSAGVGLRKKAHFADESEFDRLYDVDVKGVWMMAKAFVNQLIDHGEIGHIVNISSIHARASLQKYAIYASAKSAVEGLTRGMAIELGESGIRCNAVAPSYVDCENNRIAAASWTDDPEAFFKHQIEEFQSLRHPIYARDCGNAAVFLLSDLARSITGQTLIVDAGSSNLLHANNLIPHNK